MDFCEWKSNGISNAHVKGSHPGVGWLFEQRIGIYGASYGGYGTLAGVTFTPDLYACGVDYVGPSNLFTLLASFPPYWGLEIQQFYAMVADPVKDKDLLTAISPISSKGMRGEDDLRRLRK